MSRSDRAQDGGLKTRGCLLAAMLMFVVSATGCSSPEPELYISVDSEMKGIVSLQTPSLGGLSDLPIRTGLEILNRELQLTGENWIFRSVRQDERDWLSLQVAFATIEDLRRIISAQIEVPTALLDLFPSDLRDAVPRTFWLTDVTVQAETGDGGQENFDFHATLDPLLSEALELSGFTVRLSLPGTISNTNGVSDSNIVTWPGDDGWSTSLDATSTLGESSGHGLGWLRPFLVLILGVGLITGGWFVVEHRRKRRRRAWADPDGAEYEWETDDY